MIRKTLLAVAATALVATASMTPASAHPHGLGLGFGIGVGLGVLGGAAIAASTAPGYYYDNGCWQYQTIVTPHGHYRQVLVNVCQ